jgi:hypothetical protein
VKNKLFGIFGAALAALFFMPKGVMAIAGGQLIYDNYVPIPSAVNYSSTFSIRADGIDWASLQVVVTSVTQPAVGFTDGSSSSGTVTVVSFASLSTTTATGSITVSSNAGTANQCVSGGGPSGTGNFNVCNPANFAIGNVSSNTACNIAASINNYVVGLATCNWNSSPGVVYATAPYAGSVWNQFQLNSSSQAALGVSVLISSTVYQPPYSTMTGVGFGTMAGGQDAATLTVNGTVLLANRDWYPITSNGATATSLATAITNSSVTTRVVAAAGSQSTTVVFATSTVIGTGTNAYKLVSSSQSVLSVSSPVVTGVTGVNGYGTGSTTMFGGTNAAFLINTSSITATGNTFGSGEAVFITTSANSAVPLPLVWGTTYYVITIPPASLIPTTTIELATTLANALANTPVVITSSATNTPTDSYLLNVGAIAGTPTTTLVASNDNVHWLPYTLTPFNVTIPSSVSYVTYVSSGITTNLDLGHYNYGYLGISVLAPTAGAINVGARVVGNAP